MVVRFLAILLVALLLPLSLSAPSAMACSTNGVLRRELFDERSGESGELLQGAGGTGQSDQPSADAQHFDSIASMPVAGVIVAISHLQNTVVARGYSPPDRLASLALLCSRQI